MGGKKKCPAGRGAGCQTCRHKGYVHTPSIKTPNPFVATATRYCRATCPDMPRLYCTLDLGHTDDCAAVEKPGTMDCPAVVRTWRGPAPRSAEIIEQRHERYIEDADNQRERRRRRRELRSAHHAARRSA